MRFKVDPRDVSPEAAARRLGLSACDFAKRLPDLIARGFPSPDPTTDNFDLKAIDAWMDRRSGLGALAVPVARDASSVLEERLAGMRRG